jgi:hypothetical protein
MYFPSSSWGRFSQDLDDAAKLYLNKGGVYHEIGSTADLTMIADEFLFNDKYKPKTSLEYMKDILEGLRMPVVNPKTGEQDHVDISLVSKIVIDSEYVEDMAKNNKVKVDISLSGDADRQEVYVVAQNEIFGKLTETLPIQRFEEILSKAIHEAQDQRLEAVDEFKNIVDDLVDKFVDDNRLLQKHFARIDLEHFLKNGVGIIRDIKTNQDVGTFEEFYYVYESSGRTTIADGVILSGRNLDDLNEKDRYELAFYSIQNGTVYSVIASHRASVQLQGERVVVKNFDLVTEAFDEKHKLFDMIHTAQTAKELITGMDATHPLYASRSEEFKRNRLGMLEESKQKQKQEKLVNQFADIDLF